MANMGNKKVPFPPLGRFGYKGAIEAVIEFTIGASGAISATANTKGGISVVKTATKTGRYTVTLPSAFKKFFGGLVTVIGPTDAIWGATTVGGPDYFFRNNNIDRGTFAGTIDVQFTAAASNADADLPSGTIVSIVLHIGQGV